MVGNKCLRLIHAVRLAGDTFRRRLPDSCVEGNTVDQLICSHIIEGLFDPVCHIVDRRDTACFLASAIVLIVAHDNDIIGKHALLINTVVVVEIIGHIVVYGENEPFLTALNRELSDKFNIVLTVILGDSLNIYIDTVNSHIPDGFHDSADHRASGFSGREKSLLYAFGPVEIIKDRPDLQASLV